MFSENSCINPKELSPLNLAFIGDCVYEMLVRERLVREANRPVNDLHRESVKLPRRKRRCLSADETQKPATSQRAHLSENTTAQRE